MSAASDQPMIEYPWWAMLPAVPHDPDSPAYQRLWRLWADPTDPQRPFANPNHRLHLLAKSWELFTLFTPDNWVAPLCRTLGWQDQITKVTAARWSYDYLTGITSCSRAERLDMVNHWRSGKQDWVIATACLSPAAEITGRNDLPVTDPAFYLDQQALDPWPERRMLYIVDQRHVDLLAGNIKSPEYPAAVLSWQALAGLQIQITRRLHIYKPYRDFIAAAIQHLYMQHRIVPDTLAFDYLASEKPMATIRNDVPGKQSPEMRHHRFWQLPDR